MNFFSLVFVKTYSILAFFFPIFTFCFWNDLFLDVFLLLMSFNIIFFALVKHFALPRV